MAMRWTRTKMYRAVLLSMGLLWALAAPAAAQFQPVGPQGKHLVHLKGSVGIGAPVAPAMKLRLRTTDTRYGLFAQNLNPSNQEAFGIYAATGVGGIGTKYALFGRVARPTDYAGYFEGRGHFSGSLGIGAVDPVELLQLGDRFVFHDGGTKVLGYNFRYTGQDERIVVGPVASIRFNQQGEIRFQTAPAGPVNQSIAYSSPVVLSNDGDLGIGGPPTAQLDLKDLYPAGGRNLQVGDDTFLSDVDVANTLGIYGVQDSSVASIRLGSDGPALSGKQNRLGVGTAAPDATLDVAGDLKLSGRAVSKIVSDGAICIGNC